MKKETLIAIMRDLEEGKLFPWDDDCREVAECKYELRIAVQNDRFHDFHAMIAAMYRVRDDLNRCFAVLEQHNYPYTR